METKNKNLPIYYKSVSGNLEIKEQSRRVSGYFANFDTVDSDMDIIRKGAFSKSINERGPATSSNRQIKFLHQHNIKELAGPLLMLSEDDYGLNFEGELERTPLGDIILERYRNGTYKEHSIGFIYVWDKCNWIEIEKDGEIIEAFECKELNMFEGSVVTFGANMNTPFTGFKSSDKLDIIKQLDDELKYLLKNAPNYEYEIAVRQLYAKQYALINLESPKIQSQGSTGIDYNYLINNLKIS